MDNKEDRYDNTPREEDQDQENFSDEENDSDSDSDDEDQENNDHDEHNDSDNEDEEVQEDDQENDEQEEERDEVKVPVKKATKKKKESKREKQLRTVYDNFNYLESKEWCENKMKDQMYDTFDSWCCELKTGTSQNIVKNLKRKYESMKVYNALYGAEIRPVSDVLTNWHLQKVLV